MIDARPINAAPAAEELPFEEALARLEAIVTLLETGDLSLHDSLARFEEGIRLSRACARQLEEAETKIELLVQEDGQWQTRSFEPEPDAED